MTTTQDLRTQIAEPNLTRILLADTRLAPLWTVLRIWLGWQWLHAGWGKITNPAGVWVGEKAGVAIEGFLKGALGKTAGEHPDVSGWYASFIQNVALPNAELLSYMVAFGEVLIGVALILGIFTGIAAFFGGLMNANFLFAGTLSTNPIMLIAAFAVVLGWRVAGQYGLDRVVLPYLGVPGAPGTLFRHDARLPQTPIPPAA
ncbi:DoxX family protein [Deinococcus roseus]|nr:DoxX family protein [Deinococcus roseus]